MSAKQIESCVKRLADVDAAAANKFELAMSEAADLIALAAMVRRDAWTLYRITLGLTDE